MTPPADTVDAPGVILGGMGVPPRVSGDAALFSTAVADGGGGVGGGRLFCIFCMSERFRASNLLRNMDEYVLNFRH